MNNLLFEKGKTNWLSVVLVSSMIGALTAWVIFFMSESILEISAPDTPRNNGRASDVVASNAIVPVDGNVSEICDRAIMGRQPNSAENQQCQAAGGAWNCGTAQTDYIDRPGTSENFCTCTCSH